MLIQALILVAACGVGQGCLQPTSVKMELAQAKPDSIAIYALSRGKGVPPEARKAIQTARQLFEEGKEAGEVLNIIQTRIGLEGETRLCAEFRDVQASKEMQGRIRPLVEGVQLMNFKLEPCRR